jgi:RHS repeat-associated protein
LGCNGDHLGNVRLSYTDNNNDGVIQTDGTNSEIVEESNYYPFGLKHKGYNNVTNSLGNSTAQKFGYNGVELEESLGLNLMEMEFRQYDPTIARFTGIDPVTHHSMSTYTAFDNNPVYFSDPSGADAEDPITKKTTVITSSVDQNNVTTINQTSSTSTTVTNDDGSTTKTFSTSSITNTVDAEGNVTKGTTVTERSGTTTTSANGDSSTSLGKKTARRLNKGDSSSSLGKWTNTVSNYNKNNFGTYNKNLIENGAKLTTFAGKAGSSIISVYMLAGKLDLGDATKKLIGLGGGTYTADGLIGLLGDGLGSKIGKNNSYSIIYDVKETQNGNLLKGFKGGRSARKDVSPSWAKKGIPVFSSIKKFKNWLFK